MFAGFYVLDDPACEGTKHLFEVEHEAEPPREHTCLCGEYTWGWMNDQLKLTNMWEASS